MAIQISITSSDARRVTINYARSWSFQIMLDNAKDFAWLCKIMQENFTKTTQEI